MSDEIEHVSDTALWVAAFRAKETLRPDALFQDPLAAKLMGERGRRISAQMPGQKVMSWVMSIRTVAIDELVLSAVGQGCDTVINLGAGLDTRPYRMKLPATLNWIEVDFENVIRHKDEILKNEKPRCRLERIAADLSDEQARRRLFQKLNDQSRKAVVITEGVIPYLSNDDAAALARDLLAAKNFAYWIQDIIPMGQGRRERPWRAKLKRAPFKFQVPDWISFFEDKGWRVVEQRSMVEESERLGRPMPFWFWRMAYKIAPRKTREKIKRQSGYILLGR